MSYVRPKEVCGWCSNKLPIVASLTVRTIEGNDCYVRLCSRCRQKLLKFIRKQQGGD